MEHTGRRAELLNDVHKNFENTDRATINLEQLIGYNFLSHWWFDIAMSRSSGKSLLISNMNLKNT